MRMPPNHESRCTPARSSAHGASMEGGMRMPPNHQGQARTRASMEGGMRMPPNSCYLVDGQQFLTLQWRAACACRRISHAQRDRAELRASPASMEGGMRMPPNESFLTPRAYHGCKPGFNGGRHAHAAESPNSSQAGRHPVGRSASMEGGMRMPPNPVIGRGGRLQTSGLRFNGGRHAHAAELDRTGGRGPRRCCRRFNGGRHAHAAEFPRHRSTLLPKMALSSFNGGRHAHAAESPLADGGAELDPALQWRAACACRRMSPGVQDAHRGIRMMLQWRAACACRRMHESRAR